MFRSKIIAQRRAESAVCAGILLVMCLIAIPFSCACTPNDAVMVTEYYTVHDHEYLWDVAAKFIDKNTYGPRDIREFYYGIIELNYDRVFKGRQRGEVHAGDVLQINYWTKGGDVN